MNDSLKKLVEEYRQQQNQHPFLLVDLSGGRENTHTNILMSLLLFNNSMFLGSFLTDVLNVPDWNKNTGCTRISTQVTAVGLNTNKRTKKNTNGYIDLYIEFTDINNVKHKIVIENKINDAADTLSQMLRYIFSVKNTAAGDSSGYDSWAKVILNHCQGNNDLKNSISEERNNCHFVYLTIDGSKVPGENSLPRFMYDEDDPIIDYRPINYQDDIFPWLKDTVLRLCPYYDDGIVVAGLRQYIASLEGLLSKNITISDTVNKYVDSIKANKTINDAYKGLWNSIDEIGKYSKHLANDNEIDTCNRLARELQKAAEELITKDSVPEGWTLHISPTLLIVYKPEWMRIARGSYSIPFVNLYANPKTFLRGKKINWQLHIEHFSREKWNEWKSKNDDKSLKSTNHERTASFDLGQFKIEESNSNGWKSCIDTVIKKKADIIASIDEVVGIIDSNKMTYSNDKEIRVKLFELLAKKLVLPFNL